MIDPELVEAARQRSLILFIGSGVLEDALSFRDLEFV